MRILAFGLSAVLLSGCSWLGGMVGGGGHNGPKQSTHYTQNGNTIQKHYSYNSGGLGQSNPCQIPAPNYPIPRGCDPASVTIGTGGFPQQPNYGSGAYGGAQGGGQYAQGGYGSHAHDAQSHSDFRGQRAPKLRKPKWRGQLSLGTEKSISGNIIDSQDNNLLASYDPTDFDDVVTSRVGNRETTTTYSAGPLNLASTDLWQSADVQSVSYDDAFSTAEQISLGGEYILNKNTTLFANAGYTQADGKSAGNATVNGHLTRTISYQDFDASGAPIAGAPNPVVSQSTDLKEIARFSYDFGDMERYDLEVGARRYLQPFSGSVGGNTITPFVGASVGASYHEALSYDVTHEQINYRLSVLGADTYGTQTTEGVQVYDSQWVPTGQLNAGVDWQVTPKTALAFETGVRIEGARKYSNGEKGDKNIAIPFKIRGSYNF